MNHPNESSATERTSPHPRKKKSLLRRIMKWSLAVSTVVVIIVVIISWTMVHRARTAPEFWDRTQAFWTDTDTATLDRMAESAERRVFNQVSRRPVANSAAAGNSASSDDSSGAQTVTITLDEAISWLRQRFPQWIENSGHSLPPEVMDPMLAIEDDLLVMAFRIDTDERTNLVSLLWDIDFNDDGTGTLRLANVRLGTLDMPLKLIFDQVSAYDSSYADLAANAQSLTEGVPFEPVFTLPGSQDRTVRIRDMRLQENAIELDIEPAS